MSDPQTDMMKDMPGLAALPINRDGAYAWVNPHHVTSLVTHPDYPDKASIFLTGVNDATVVYMDAVQVYRRLRLAREQGWR